MLEIALKFILTHPTSIVALPRLRKNYLPTLLQSFRHLPFVLRLLLLLIFCQSLTIYA